MRVKETGEMLLNHAAGYAADYSALFTSRSLVDKGWVESRNYLTGNQSIALSGDVTGSGATSIATSVNWANGFSALDTRYLRLSGGNMTGALILSADPATALGAATKQYVDTQVAAGSSQWTTSGNDIFYNNGNAGVGTTTPQNKLDVVTGSAGTMGKGTYEMGSFERDHDTKLGVYCSSTNPNYGTALVFGFTNQLNANNNYPGFSIQQLFRSNPDDNILRFNALERNANGAVIGAHVEILNLLGNGNVGIGTSAPNEKLEVAGTIFSSTGGFKFPDGSLQTTAAVTDNLWTSGTGQYSIMNNQHGLNNAQAAYSLIGGGNENLIYPNATYGTILAGEYNQIQNSPLPLHFHNMIGSGSFNIIQHNALYAAILGGNGNTNDGPFGIILGGTYNAIESSSPGYNLIAGGNGNRIKTDASYSSIVGGAFNVIETGIIGSVILCGLNITATRSHTAYMPNLTVTSLAGIGDRLMMVDANGNLTSGPHVTELTTDPWELGGNDLANDSTAFIGTQNAADLVFKTNSANAPDGGEHMRITATGLHAGNVGIGTSAPEKKLHIVTKHNSCLSCGPGTHEGIRLEEQTTYTDVNSTVTSIWDLQPYGPGFAIKKPNEDPKMLITDAGNVGIGTNNPTAKLEVAGTIKAAGLAINGTIQASAFASFSPLKFEAPAGVERMRIDDITGNVVIGSTVAPTNIRLHVEATDIIGFCSKTKHPTDYNYNIKAVVDNDNTKALAVIDKNGNDQFLVYGDGYVFAREFKVTLGAYNHPDYVFAKDYKLTPLSELRQFLKTNQHFPDMLSSAEVKKLGGLPLGDMQERLLKIQEHQILYTFQLDDKIAALEKKNKERIG